MVFLYIFFFILGACGAISELKSAFNGKVLRASINIFICSLIMIISYAKIFSIEPIESTVVTENLEYKLPDCIPESKTQLTFLGSNYFYMTCLSGKTLSVNSDKYWYYDVPVVQASSDIDNLFNDEKYIHLLIKIGAIMLVLAFGVSMHIKMRNRYC